MVTGRKTLGVSLVETMVSVAIMAFIFGALAFLVFYAGRNSYIVNDQVKSQTNAASAAERIANTLRTANYFDFHGGDDSATTPLLKLAFGIPSNEDPSDVTTGIVAFKSPSKPGATDGIVKIFDDINDFDIDAKADWEYHNLTDFSIIRQSPYWANFQIGYVYRGFRLDSTDTDKDGHADSTLRGQFVTDVIAKNHNTGDKDTNANYTTSTLTSL